MLTILFIKNVLLYAIFGLAMLGIIFLRFYRVKYFPLLNALMDLIIENFKFTKSILFILVLGAIAFWGFSKIPSEIKAFRYGVTGSQFETIVYESNKYGISIDRYLSMSKICKNNNFPDFDTCWDANTLGFEKFIISLLLSI
jgi:hypothetical protein